MGNAGVPSNAARKFRASRPDGIALPSKGNARSMATAPEAPKDRQPAFPQVVFGDLKPYRVRPYEVVNGIFFDVAPRVGGVLPREPKAPKTPTKTTTRRRRDPGAGTRPSLRSIRSKG